MNAFVAWVKPIDLVIMAPKSNMSLSEYLTSILNNYYSSLFSRFIFLMLFNDVYVEVVCACECRCLKRQEASDPPEAGVQEVVSHPAWVQRLTLKSPGRAIHTLSHQAVNSPALTRPPWESNFPSSSSSQPSLLRDQLHHPWPVSLMGTWLKALAAV